MTRLGFVGVGRHAQKMAAAFRECGAEIVAHARSSMAMGVQGPFAASPTDPLPWPDMIASPSIDALIICAPPEVTTEVALACAKAGKRCVATKPLMLQQPPVWRGFPAPFEFAWANIYVDLWRLYSPAWQAMKAELRGKQIQSVHVDFYGNGPVRSFSGLLDYGPHALAFVADLLGGIPKLHWDDFGYVFGSDGLWTADSDEHVSFAMGNRVPTGEDRPQQARRIVVRAGGKYFEWHEDPVNGDHVYTVDREPVMQHMKSLALRNFCRAFLAGDPSDTLRISCEAMRVLMPLVTEPNEECPSCGVPILGGHECQGPPSTFWASGYLMQ